MSYLTPRNEMTKAQKSRARREPSGVFTNFQPAQIQQFKEAFQLIDHDKDGWVNESDLVEIFGSLGITPTKSMLTDLLNSRPGGMVGKDSPKGINFTMFLTMMSERLFEFDTEAELVEAFESFDDDDSGSVNIHDMKKWLGDYGDRMSEPEMDKFLTGPFTDRQGNFNYREWVKVLRVNEEETEEAP
ncbi:calcium-binding EF-hand domain-containing protein [Flagelloscypha sp. PMI_526]|nr:calcium-binding EF-hand domain-containing protein [Flagelloscypha sp. PMI_526]